jgi:hypothetical protein
MLLRAEGTSSLTPPSFCGSFTHSVQPNRPKNALTEGRYEDLLCFNGLLEYIAEFLNNRVFQDSDHNTMEGLFAVRPPEDKISRHIPWREDLLDQPFYISPTHIGRIETASAIMKRLFTDGINAGMPEPVRGHDWRARFLDRAGI